MSVVIPRELILDILVIASDFNALELYKLRIISKDINKLILDIENNANLKFILDIVDKKHFTWAKFIESHLIKNIYFRHAETSLKPKFELEKEMTDTLVESNTSKFPFKVRYNTGFTLIDKRTSIIVIISPIVNNINQIDIKLAVFFEVRPQPVFKLFNLMTSVNSNDYGDFVLDWIIPGQKLAIYSHVYNETLSKNKLYILNITPKDNSVVLCKELDLTSLKFNRFISHPLYQNGDMFLFTDIIDAKVHYIQINDIDNCMQSNFEKHVIYGQLWDNVNINMVHQIKSYDRVVVLISDKHEFNALKFNPKTQVFESLIYVEPFDVLITDNDPQDIENDLFHFGVKQGTQAFDVNSKNWKISKIYTHDHESKKLEDCFTQYIIDTGDKLENAVIQHVHNQYRRVYSKETMLSKFAIINVKTQQIYTISEQYLAKFIHINKHL